MSLRREKFGLPLLQRELTELSARPRTFLTRAVYAVIFFGLIGWQFGEQFSRSDADALLDLGRGRQLFDQLVLWQLGGRVSGSPDSGLPACRGLGWVPCSGLGPRFWAGSPILVWVPDSGLCPRS